MANDVKWIKLMTDMFDDEKIDFITSLPESDAIIVIWVRLLTLAGKCNAGGYIYLTEKIPYTEDMLANKFKKQPAIVKLALETFKRLDMIDMDESGIFLPKWERHQNVEGLEKIREQTALRVSKHRSIQKQLEDVNNVTQKCNVTVTQCNATELDRELELDKEENIKPNSQQNKFADDAIEYVLASELYNLMLENNPSAKKPILRAWAKSIDLMIRVDKRSVGDIRSVIQWSQKDSFWQTNILSTKKLRDKYDQLAIKMKSVQRGDKSRTPNFGADRTVKKDSKYESMYL
jgi:predicted phage replisome organizer